MAENTAGRSSTPEKTDRQDTTATGAPDKAAGRADFTRVALERAARAAHDAGDQREVLARKVEEAKQVRKAAKAVRRAARAQLELADRDVAVSRKGVQSLKEQLKIAVKHADAVGKDAEKAERDHNDALRTATKKAKKAGGRDTDQKHTERTGDGESRTAGPDSSSDSADTGATRTAGRKGGLAAKAADVAEKATDRIAGAANDLEQKADDAAASTRGTGRSRTAGTASASGTSPRTPARRAARSRTGVAAGTGAAAGAATGAAAGASADQQHDGAFDLDTAREPSDA